MADRQLVEKIFTETIFDENENVTVKEWMVEDGKFKFNFPKNIIGKFNCDDNKLTSLEGAPSSVGGSFYCCYNQLTSLEGAPSLVGGSFFCYNNKLTSLEGAPSSVGRYFNCENNVKKFTQPSWLKCKVFES